MVGDDEVTKLPPEAEEAMELSEVLELELEERPSSAEPAADPTLELVELEPPEDLRSLSSMLMRSIMSERTSVASLRASGSHLPVNRACHQALLCLSEGELRKTSARLSSTTRRWSPLRSSALCSVARSRRATASRASCCLHCGLSRKPQASILKTIRSTSETYGRLAGDGVVSLTRVAALGRKGHSISGVMRTSIPGVRAPGEVGKDEDDLEEGEVVW